MLHQTLSNIYCIISFIGYSGKGKNYRIRETRSVVSCQDLVVGGVVNCTEAAEGKLGGGGEMGDKTILYLDFEMKRYITEHTTKTSVKLYTINISSHFIYKCQLHVLYFKKEPETLQRLTCCFLLQSLEQKNNTHTGTKDTGLISPRVQISPGFL